MPITTSSTSTYVRCINYGSASGSGSPRHPPMTVFDRVLLAQGQTRTHDGPVPNFRLRIARGQDASTNLSGSKTSIISSSRGYGRLILHDKPSNTWQWYEVEGEISFPDLPNAIVISTTTADDHAKMSFVKKIRAAQTTLQGGIVSGEIGQTIKMLKSPAQALRKGIDDYLNALKKGRRGSQSRKRRFVSETWLEYSFGLKPFLSDIDSAAQALAEIRYGKPVRKPVSGKGDLPMSQTQSRFGAAYGPLSWWVRDISEGRAIVVYRGAVDCPVGNRAIMAQQNLGFDLNNFVPTLWELAPWSFLFDYFTNIGDILSSWSLWNANLAWSNKVVIAISSRDRFVDSINPWVASNKVEERVSGGQSRSERRSVNRSVVIGSLVPSFGFEIPGASSLKWLNLAALARTRKSLSPF